MSLRQYNYRLGVQEYQDKKTKGILVYYASAEEECGIVLYDKMSGEEVARYAFSLSEKVGDVFCKVIPDVNLEQVSYLFYEGDRLVIDKYAVQFAGADSFGMKKGPKEYRGICETLIEYDWEEDVLPKLPYEECVGYCMHVRGFTKDKSSKVKAKGTFRGIAEKIPYLKELGVTTLELQPAYEFNENPEVVDLQQAVKKQPEQKINYWGYQEGYYYAPKRAYAYGKDVTVEFKDMVKELHKNNMELVMQFYFPDSVSRLEIAPILRFWRMEYHVDGFHLKGLDLPIKALAEDMFLKDVKLWYYDFPIDALYPGNAKPVYKKLAMYNDAYTYNLRRLLQGEEGMLYEGMKYMRMQPAKCGIVNYLTNYEGFTMADLVAYNEKHNEANGEENRDGTDYNCSWNCGKEGNTKSKKVNDLRKKQLRNAFALLMLSQGMPMFFMGDEFGNSQGGNNNPYCQDNETTWLDWTDLEKNRELFTYVKRMIAFRRENRMSGCLNRENKVDEIKSLGYPDISYHGSEAWMVDWSRSHIGYLVCGDYARVCEGQFIYVAINMDNKEQKLALPKLPKGVRWTLCFSTDDAFTESCQQESEALFSGPEITVTSRSITVFCSIR